MSPYIRRIIKAGILNFWRNGWVSLATVLVMVLTLFVTGALVFSNVLLESALTRIEEKVDISVYFKLDAPEDEMLALKSKVEKLGEVKAATYTSREDALANFKARHANNALITQSLEELGENPLGASLNIRAENPEHYGSIAQFLASPSFADIIDKVNYFQNKVVIDRLSGILAASQRVGFGTTLVLAIIAVLVAFNTIRLAIYTSKDEIQIMRLVGATNNFIRSPFIIEGVLYGVISAVTVIVAFYPLTLWLGPKAEQFLGGPNLFEYYIANFFQLFALLLIVGIALGSLSSFIAIRRYLKI